MVNDYITIHNPTVEEVEKYGEEKYVNLLHAFVRRPYDIAVELDDKGVDYQTLTDWDLFLDTIYLLPKDYTSILFGDLDFSNFRPYTDVEKGINILIDITNPQRVIDEVIFKHMTFYLRYVNYIDEKIEYDMGNEIGKKFLLKRMRRKQKKMLDDYKSGKIKKHSTLAGMIRYCVNNPGFKYDYDGVMNLKITQLYESYHMLTYNNDRDHVINGIYNATIDVSKMKDKSILSTIPDLHK